MLPELHALTAGYKVTAEGVKGGGGGMVYGIVEWGAGLMTTS